ncbi:MAG: hypothetical protein IJ583_14755 [Firmicutes bacterium]|nr:hypothetical protein [Bacillota bacterium]
MKKQLYLAFTAVFLFSCTVKADLISVKQNEKDESTAVGEETKLGLLSTSLEDVSEMSILSSSTKDEADSEDPDSKNDKALMSDIEKYDIDEHIFDYRNIEVINADEILSELDLSSSDEILDFDYVIKEYNYRSDMQEVYKNINNDAISVIDRYMQKTSYIPLKDPLWFFALGAVEYNYYANDPDIICSWPIDVEAYKADPNYMLGYNWKDIQKRLGNAAVVSRTGGAIGPFQMESFYGKNSSPVIPSEFGLIGSSEQRSDCWVELGACTDSGSSIIWQKGTYADRWNIADAANLCLGVYDETLRRVNGKCALTEFNDKYEQAVFLMWAHNRGTGILGDREYKKKVEAICTHIDELKEVIYKLKPNRFTRSENLMAPIKKIANESGSDNYPVMALASYLIVEARYSGAW